MNFLIRIIKKIKIIKKFKFLKGNYKSFFLFKKKK